MYSVPIAAFPSGVSGWCGHGKGETQVKVVDSRGREKPRGRFATLRRSARSAPICLPPAHPRAYTGGVIRTAPETREMRHVRLMLLGSLLFGATAAAQPPAAPPENPPVTTRDLVAALVESLRDTD